MLDFHKFSSSSSKESLNADTLDSSKITNTDDCLNKILSASNLEKSGDIIGAISLYQEVIKTDKNGTYKAIAEKALETLKESKSLVSDTEHITENSSLKTIKTIPFYQRLLKRFYDLPIQTKQLAVLLTSEIVAIVGLVGVGSILIVTNGQFQLINQAKSELKVAEINYNLKLDQMELSFNGQANNVAIIEAAEKGKADGTVLNILANEIWKQKIEFSTLVNRQGMTIATGNIKVNQRSFDPQGLVTQALKSGRQSKITESISYDELAKENDYFAKMLAQDLGLDPSSKPNFLIRYTITPVRNGKAEIVGALISGDIVKPPIVNNTVTAFNSGYSGVYLYKENGNFSLATSQLISPQGKLRENPILPNNKLLQKAIDAQGKVITGNISIDNQQYTIAAKALFNAVGEPIGVLLRGTSHYALNSLIMQSLGLQTISALLAICVSIILAKLLGKAVLNPLKKLRQITAEFSSGNRQIRAENFANDEMGELANTFNTMADSIVTSEAELANYAQQQEAEAEKQRKARENLQQEVIQMLLDIEEAQKGNLTVEAKVTEGVVGSVADAFNTTIRSLRQLVSQVQMVSSQVNYLVLEEETEIQNLSQAAINQAQEINQVFQDVADINTSIQNVANSTQEAAKIAQVVRQQAQEGDIAMLHTVNSIQKIRSSVAGTAKKLKQLAESSQEISQIVTIISSISEKTNVLAFNASIEAARAGEHGDGFRAVAEEVSRLAVKVTDATQDIQHLVETIQEDTSKVLEDMENSTAEVVTGTQLIRQTQEILQSLAITSEHIDEYLQNITSNTTAQTHASQQINHKIKGVAMISQQTSIQAENMVTSLQSLVEKITVLQASVAQFRLQS
ncbi:methyl-accepting chemotaxis protein [Crocosphaera sp. XPORK-15E]|uniref:methyl-accepting chemotaxis protein n=1 Tax=Crocosphaera sp. XPORK-15E TaxID=3110247 RepID=UPI002B1F836C|nr:methyl-accepting chemotaxis protein [Crocosphaera sp. XPORK-15E]MEA5532596.1 methyl-accepting chemotaxis protein [Crocosphaera sp. XPORK-15E]